MGLEQIPKEPTPEEIETDIAKFLERLDAFAYMFDDLEDSDQETWYAYEMEAKCGKDRGTALTKLKAFVEYLEKTGAEKTER